ncbi:hypothetical protein PPYR_04520 [Photinus pyralis]|uniref:Nose resistant-to-fluoxetine protein N-terminal domain-containing protein n=2 Tax=Photinus pyralis TaxID=7054 RepID=A0A5N4AYC0_PHOPY|nr:nose resistant to fluoxetine protein 6-like [Photinus pyralis]KAB0802334.1 hypothetical protein PPYR_04520 [Photinus pyralis]
MFSVATLIIISFLFQDTNGNVYTDTFSIYKQFITNIPVLTNSEKISSECAQQLNIYSQHFNNGTEWAIKMFYANGLHPLEISPDGTSSLGNYDACLSLHETMGEDVVAGKYCLGNFLLTNQTKSNETLRSGLCFPSKCSALEMEDIFRRLTASVQVDEDVCDSYGSGPSLNGTAILLLALLAGLLALVVFSTVAHMKYGNKNVILSAFSLKNNITKCLATSTNAANTISCLEGMRVLSLMWIIVRHVFRSKRLRIRSVRDEVIHTMVLGGSLAVDTFFVMSGMLLVYNEMKRYKKDAIQLNPCRRYAARLLRLLPVLTVIVVFHLSLLKHVGDGPLWKLVRSNDACQTYWWSTLLFVQNYVNPGNMCSLASWYLCADMQLFILSPLLLVPLQRKPFWGMLLAGALLGCLTVAPFTLPWIFDADTLKAISLKQKYQTHMRATPWFVGFILGYIIHVSRTRKYTLNKVLCGVLWMASLAVFVGLIILGVHTRNYTSEYKLENATRMGLMHPLWSLAIAWLIYACRFGYGGFVNKFLSLPIFQVLSKFTYTAYLVHFEFVIIAHARIRIEQPLTITEAILRANGHMLETLYVSVILTLCLEMPFITISRLIKNK